LLKNSIKHFEDVLMLFDYDSQAAFAISNPSKRLKISTSPNPFARLIFSGSPDYKRLRPKQMQRRIFFRSDFYHRISQFFRVARLIAVYFVFV